MLEVLLLLSTFPCHDLFLLQKKRYWTLKCWEKIRNTWKEQGFGMLSNYKMGWCSRFCLWPAQIILASIILVNTHNSYCLSITFHVRAGSRSQMGRARKDGELKPLRRASSMMHRGCWVNAPTFLSLLGLGKLRSSTLYKHLTRFRFINSTANVLDIVPIFIALLS